LVSVIYKVLLQVFGRISNARLKNVEEITKKRYKK